MSVAQSRDGAFVINNMWPLVTKTSASLLADNRSELTSLSRRFLALDLYFLGVIGIFLVIFFWQLFPLQLLSTVMSPPIIFGVLFYQLATRKYVRTRVKMTGRRLIAAQPMTILFFPVALTSAVTLMLFFYAFLLFRTASADWNIVKYISYLAVIAALLFTVTFVWRIIIVKAEVRRNLRVQAN
ncbi:hypothetical protein ACSHT0_09005 [Tepidicaulis sp. LMO-SS28]|uniref:hypothetical protein n=1 Tax=Tepidicaulis sp. LMO-SS28 TaxID=3447455 RepID=UPI003EE12E99